MKNKNQIILDSGAFSAWMKQEVISVEEYTKYALAVLDKVDYVVNLDMIPGRFGKKNLSQKEINKSTSVGWDNYAYMLHKGIPKDRLIHVFHQGEDFHHLEDMVDQMPYIGISPANDRNTTEKMQWIDHCMKYVLVNKKPIVKFHGFAVTSVPIMTKFPWHSVDSTSWVTFGRYGAILFPKIKYGKYNYTEPPTVVFVSDKSPQVAIKGKHIQNLSKLERTTIKNYITSRGFSLKKTRNSCLVRDRLNMLFYIDIEQYMRAEGINIHVYFAGNFPMLSKIKREIKTQKIALKHTDFYNRLGSFYHKKHMDKLLQLRDK